MAPCHRSSTTARASETGAITQRQTPKPAPYPIQHACCAGESALLRRCAADNRRTDAGCAIGIATRSSGSGERPSCGISATPIGHRQREPAPPVHDAETALHDATSAIVSRGSHSRSGRRTFRTLLAQARQHVDQHAPHGSREHHQPG
jgi:hypothetical protein